MTRFILCVLVTLAFSWAPAHAQRTVAISLDDLPYVGQSLEEARYATPLLLDALAAHEVSADVFIEGRRVEVDGEVEARRDLLRQWRNAGHALHNHGYSHLHYSKTEIPEYLTDVGRGYTIVADLLSEAPSFGRVHFFRPPFNDLGESATTRVALVESLDERGVRLAPFTVEHSDWMFNAAYEEALARGDSALVRRVGQAYLAQLDTAFAFAERLSTETFGREIPQVFLLHANRLNADHLDAMLERMSSRGYGFVSMEEAMADPAYDTPDEYRAKWGVSWLHRWRVGLGLPNLLREEPEPPTWLIEPGEPAQTPEPARGTAYSDHVRGYLSYDDPMIALVGVNVIDGTGQAARRDQAVLIEGGRIIGVGPADSVAIPEGARVLDLPGRTVIPGLVGMHDHTHMPGITFMGYTASRLWLASGVTTVQTAGSAEPDAEVALALAIETGEAVGPTLFPTAHYITGPGGNGPMSKPGTEEEARELVREWSESGATWFKLYRHVEPNISAAVIDEAHALGRKVTGHLCSLTFREAALLGIDSIEHGLISSSDFLEDKLSGECVSARGSVADLDLGDARVAELIDLLVREDVTLTSTLAIIESHFPHRPQGDERSLVLMSPEWRQRYDERQASLAEGRASTTMTPELLAKFMAFERMFVEAGGHLVMGPDPGRHVLPGYGNQRGFELLVEAGFTIPEALQIATANGADALGEGDQIGRIAEGYVADLVVLQGELNVEPTAIRNVEVVFKDGVGYDPSLLIADVIGQVGLR